MNTLYEEIVVDKLLQLVETRLFQQHSLVKQRSVAAAKTSTSQVTAANQHTTTFRNSDSFIRQASTAKKKGKLLKASALHQTADAAERGDTTMTKYLHQSTLHRQV